LVEKFPTVWEKLPQVLGGGGGLTHTVQSNDCYVKFIQRTRHCFEVFSMSVGCFSRVVWKQTDVNLCLAVDEVAQD